MRYSIFQTLVSTVKNTLILSYMCTHVQHAYQTQSNQFSSTFVSTHLCFIFIERKKVVSRYSLQTTTEKKIEHNQLQLKLFSSRQFQMAMSNLSTLAPSLADYAPYYYQFRKIHRFLVSITYPYIFFITFVGFITNTLTVILLSKKNVTRNLKNKWTLIALGTQALSFRNGSLNSKSAKT